MNLIVVGLSFAAFLIAFTLIGVMSSREKQETSEDYLVASRSVNPWLTALSAVATANSGYMFVGLIGYAWLSGIEAMWVTFGWIAGDLVTWFWVHKIVRERSERLNTASVPALLATENDGTNNRLISVASAFLTLFFLGGYAAAQLKAGSVTLNAVFDWPIELGAVLGVVVVVVYCFSGGIRASIWTDAAQSSVMIVAMAILLGVCVGEVGGFSMLMQRLEAIDPDLVSYAPKNLLFPLAVYVLGFVGAGIGTVGQPHILIRFMAIESTKSLDKARILYFIWFTLFSAAALGVGLYARVLVPDLTAGLEGAAITMAAESALPALAIKMLPSALIGVMLAGIFSATMSTADSQILSCSAAITQDAFPQFKSSYKASKIATISVALLALVIALTASQGVFAMVLLAWAALGASLGPILVIRLANLPIPGPLGLVMMASGLATVVFWGNSAYGDSLYKIVPGMAVPSIIYAVVYFAELRNKEP
ncbi:MAG: sodium/proline symporter [Deltaproteobacteria bacterium]|nr:sodium/proline symporter [Deltaproteobacteria bacterium]